MKKQIEIEMLLRWVYRDELPKMHSGSVGGVGMLSGWHGIERYAELLTIIDAPVNQYGLVGDYGTSSEPHPDAVQIGDAVQELQFYEFTVPENWNPIADLGDLGDLGRAAINRAIASMITVVDGRRRLRRTLPQIIMRQAILNTAPDWHADIPAVKPVLGPFGKPKWWRRSIVQIVAGGEMEMEVDGFNPKSRRPYADAYQKYCLAPCPVGAIIARAEYELWMTAMAHLVDVLPGVLVDHHPLPSPRPVRPWDAGKTNDAVAVAV